MTDLSFGRQLLDLTPAEILDAEAGIGLTDDVSDLLAAVARHALAGAYGITTRDRQGPNQAEIVTVVGLTAAQRERLSTRYDLGAQEARGAWYLPERLRLRPGFVNLTGLVDRQPRFAVSLARDQSAATRPRDNADALFAWSIAIPFFEALYAPIDVRTATGKLQSSEIQRGAWAAIDALYADLGLDLVDAIAPMRYGSGWGRLHIDAQQQIRTNFVSAIRSRVTDETVARWRARHTKSLADAFYRKAKRGTPLARTVLTKTLQAPLAGLFGGDWIAFLNYLGEAANDGEQITTTLPKERIFVTTQDKTATVAAAQGLPVDEVERMLAAYLGEQAGQTSPVLERVAAMRRWWDYFDAAHANQRSGMPSLWGLVEDGWIRVYADNGPTVELYRRFIPTDLCADIERLWDGITLPRWPERIVSEFTPHHQLADAFGPALAFWDAAALTCWFICEGPFSRTDLAGLENHQRRELHDLTEMGFPISDALFTDLAAAESQLGPVQELWDDLGFPDSIASIRISRGSRRDGFEILNDIVTRHRRAWADTHLDAYLAVRWETELRTVAREYSRRTASRGGKAPTIKQFAAVGADAANHWFGGDLARLYAGVGERAAVTPRRVDLLVGDPAGFVRTVYRILGGGPPLSDHESMTDGGARNRQYQLERLATQATKYLQLYEALDRPPTPKEFGSDRVDWVALGWEETGWQRFESAIEQARQQSQPGQVDRPVPPTAKAPRSSASPPPPPVSAVPAEWYPDPAGRFEHRYWNGTQWTEHVSTRGKQSVDPLR